MAKYRWGHQVDRVKVLRHYTNWRRGKEERERRQQQGTQQWSTTGRNGRESSQQKGVSGRGIDTREWFLRVISRGAETVGRCTSRGTRQGRTLSREADR